MRKPIDVDDHDVALWGQFPDHAAGVAGCTLLTGIIWDTLFSLDVEDLGVREGICVTFFDCFARCELAFAADAVVDFCYFEDFLEGFEHLWNLLHLLLH